MSKVIPFEKAHMALMEMREIERVEWEADPLKSAKTQAMENSLQAGTILHDGRILACFGFILLWPGVVEVWCSPSKYVQQYPRTYVRTVKQYLASIEEMFQPHRIQTTALADELHARWMNALGFEFEGLLAAYSTHKRNYCMWSKIRREGV